MQIHRHMFKDTQKDMKTQTDRNMLTDTRTGTHANVQRPANIKKTKLHTQKYNHVTFASTRLFT